jgi:hypothetical protein
MSSRRRRRRPGPPRSLVLRPPGGVSPLGLGPEHRHYARIGVKFPTFGQLTAVYGDLQSMAATWAPIYSTLRGFYVELSRCEHLLLNLDRTRGSVAGSSLSEKVKDKVVDALDTAAVGYAEWKANFNPSGGTWTSFWDNMQSQWKKGDRGAKALGWVKTMGNELLSDPALALTFAKGVVSAITFRIQMEQANRQAVSYLVNAATKKSVADFAQNAEKELFRQQSMKAQQPLKSGQRRTITAASSRSQLKLRRTSKSGTTTRKGK